MRKSKFTDNQIMDAVKRVEAGFAVPDICRELGISTATFYISSAIQNWASEWGIRLEYIQPGNPQQNAYVERFNRTVRYEWLSQYYGHDLAEVQDFATKWMWSYNHDRPNMALGGFTPKQRLAMAA